MRPLWLAFLFLLEGLVSREGQKNYDLILSAEESFARAVALGIWVQRPLTAWHYLLPGMFLWDFIRRRSATERYSSLFLFPRKLALDIASRIMQGENQEVLLSRAEEEIEAWLSALKLHSGRILRGHMEQIRILVEHYSRLLRAKGDSYLLLVRKTYLTRENYDAFLVRLTAAEGEVDQGLAEIQGGTAEAWERLRAEQKQVAQLREKERNRIFPPGR